MHVAWVQYGGRFAPPCALAPPVRVVIWHGCMHEWKGRPVFGIGGTELFLILLFGFLIFGPDKLPAIAKTVGKAISKFRSAQDEMNKVVKTEADAMSRARNEAAPINAQRFGIDTPCSKNGTCFDCKSPQCICCQILTTRFSRVKGRFQIILVDENLGF